MSSILDRAKAHYAAIPRREIKIPEWSDEKGPAVITWTELSVRDQERIYEPDASGRAASGALVRLRAVIIKASDDNGNLLFDGMAENDLRYNVSGDIIGRIANAILFGAGLVNNDGTVKQVADQIDDAKKA